jgi:hypothetical protein
VLAPFHRLRWLNLRVQLLSIPLLSMEDFVLIVVLSKPLLPGLSYLQSNFPI